MDLEKIIGELKAERENLDEAILTLQHLQRGRSRRRGRPPSWPKGYAGTAEIQESEGVVPQKPIGPLTKKPGRKPGD